MKVKKQRTSERISEICKLFDSVPKDYAWCSDKVNEMDKLTQDYLHMLELDGLKYEERAKVATQLAKCRQTRREYKDEMQVLEPLAGFLCSDKGVQSLKQLREVLGQTRRREEHMKSRMYCPRVLGQEKHRENE